MSKAPAFQLYAADFYMDTLSWTTEEIGAYLRLLLYEWINGPLPNDPKQLYGICGFEKNKNWKRKWESVSQNLLKKFSRITQEILTKYSHLTPENENKLINFRLEDERKKQLQYRELQSQKGKISAEKRAEQQPTTVEPELQPEGNSSVFSLQSSLGSSSNIGGSSSKAIYSANTENFVLPSKDETANFSDLKLEESIEDICKQLYERKIFPEVFAFKNKMAGDKKSKRALLHTLGRCYLTKPKEPWAYCQQIIKVENGNFNEQEYRKDH
jgi:uncharacterized protein YdaU (DUF1376 family)